MPRRTTAALLASLGLIGCAAHTFAQPASPSPSPSQSQARQVPARAPGAGSTMVTSDGKVLTQAADGSWVDQVERPSDVLGLSERVSITFPGGTVADYVQVVRAAAAPKAVNILVPTELNDLPLPSIRLQSVTLWTAWCALEPAIRAQPGAIEIEIQPLGGRSGSTVSSEAVQIAVDRRRNVGMSFPSDARAMESAEVVIISIADLVEPRVNGGAAIMKVEDVLAAVESAARISAESGASLPALKFHPPTGVLISRGSGQANGLVKEVVATIRQNSVARAEQMDRAKLAKDVYEQRIAGAKAQVEAAESNLVSAQRRLGERQKLMETGSIAKSEADDAMARYDDAQRTLDLQKQQLAMLQSMGVESIQTELTVKGQRQDLSDRVAQLEREVEALKTLLNMNTGRQGPSQPGRGGR